jgi:hypothetical protein
MRRTVPLALLSGLMIGLAVVVASASTQRGVRATEGCTNHSLRGAYGFASDGQAFGPTGTEIADIAAAGRIVFDGHGNLTGQETESLNGVITMPAISGTYTVLPDCTGTATVHNGQTAHLRFMLVEGGQEVNIIGTDPGVVAAGQITRQQMSHCTTASFKGVYNFAASGSVWGPSGEIGDIAAFGRIVADGRGNSTESSNGSFNGFQDADTQVGTYTVNSDCTGTATSVHQRSGQVDHVWFIMVEGGAEAKFIVLDPGVVFAGTVDKQPSESEDD